MRKMWLVVALACAAAFALAQDNTGTGNTSTGMTAEQQQAMQAWMKAMTPGPQHEQLKGMVGNWKLTLKDYMAPGGPKVSTGTSVQKLVMGGRFVQQEVTGTMMGQPFTGFGMTGYDNMKQRYNAFWIDSTGTSMAIMYGTYDAATKTYTFTGDMDDPATGKSLKMRSTTRIEGPDRHVFTMYMPGPDGKEMVGLEIVYERA